MLSFYNKWIDRSRAEKEPKKSRKSKNFIIFACSEPFALQNCLQNKKRLYYERQGFYA